MKLIAKLTPETDQRLERLTQAVENIGLALLLIAATVVITQTLNKGGTSG